MINKLILTFLTVCLISSWLPAQTKTDPLKLAAVKGGAFMMGCVGAQHGCGDDEKPVHEVTLSDFYIGCHEVTQQLWTEVMSSNPSAFNGCSECPVEQVSWNEVQTFLKKLNLLYPGWDYRLPTESEWEYAARGAGKGVLFGNGKNTADPKKINFDAGESYQEPYSIVGQSRYKTIKVGSTKSPNNLKLHDMSGNVWEFCSDRYGVYSSDAQKNPTGPTSGNYRVIRGGSWNNGPKSCRTTSRDIVAPDDANNSLGFRLARSTKR